MLIQCKSPIRAVPKRRCSAFLDILFFPEHGFLFPSDSIAAKISLISYLVISQIEIPSPPLLGTQWQLRIFICLFLLLLGVRTAIGNS
jgi:hypothetical protein